MKYLRWLVIAAFIAGVVVAIGMVKLDWKVAGYTWDDIQGKFLPTKKKLEKKRGEYFQEAVDSAEDR